MALSRSEEDALPLPGMPEAVRISAGVGDRLVLTTASPAWLATLTTCCVCGGPLPPGNRYLCADCGCGDGEGGGLMADVVVTVPKRLWNEWLAEGDLPGEAATGDEYAYWLGGAPPRMRPGDRVYICAHGKLRGYAPLTRIVRNPGGGFGLCRRGGAVACTIDEPIPGFRGVRSVWWGRDAERSFPEWRVP